MSYVGAAANIVGGELSGWANLLERDAMFDEYKKELGRQSAFADQAGGVVDKAIQQGGRSQADAYLARGAGERRAAYTEANAIPLSLTPQPGSGGVEGVRDKAFAQQRGQERASLGAYGDWALNRTLNDIQNKESMRQITDFAAGQARVYPYRAYQAQHSQDDLAMIGAAISSIGGGAANYSQFAQQPGGNNMTPTATGAQDPYGVGYQMNPKGQIYSGSDYYGDMSNLNFGF